MGVKEKRAQYKEAFRREILDAARELFLADGYEKFSMRRLAEKIGYSPTTIYLYFKNKDDLLLAICEEVSGQFISNLNRIISLSDDPIENLREALLFFIRFWLENPQQFKLFFTKPALYGGREEFMEKESMARDAYCAFRAIVMNCIQSGRLVDMDVDVLTNTFAVAPYGLVARNIYNTIFPTADNEAVARTLVDGLLKGLQKQPA